jgi:hypothetical protein
LLFWYFSIVISRIVLIGLISSCEMYLLIPFLLFILIISSILNKLEKKYYEQKKFMVEFEKEKNNCRQLSNEEYGQDIIQIFIYFKYKSISKLTFFYLILGVYKNIFINIECHSGYFYHPRHTKNYIIFYFLFYIQNIIFAIILYFRFNNNLRIILFYVLTFPISVLIQILYRRVRIEKKVIFIFIFIFDSKG